VTVNIGQMLVNAARRLPDRPVLERQLRDELTTETVP
jgi:hypothetical protein